MVLEEKLNQHGHIGAAAGREICQQPESVRPASLGPAPTRAFRRETRGEAAKGITRNGHKVNTKPEQNGRCKGVVEINAVLEEWTMTGGHSTVIRKHDGPKKHVRIHDPSMCVSHGIYTTG